MYFPFEGLSVEQVKVRVSRPGDSKKIAKFKKDHQGLMMSSLTTLINHLPMIIATRKLFYSSLSLIFGAFALFQFTACSKDEDPVKLEIGQSHKGGIIFYLDGTKEHGLIAAPHDQNIAPWSTANTATSATGIAVGTGQTNTATIIAVQGAGSYAAKVCDQLDLNGFSDWFLPSRDELAQLYNQKNLVGGFVAEHYWSSTESANQTAWAQLFLNGDQNSSLAKSNSLSIRAVRAF